MTHDSLQRQSTAQQLQPDTEQNINFIRNIEFRIDLYNIGLH
jgi:hypothetical protein